MRDRLLSGKTRLHRLITMDNQQPQVTENLYVGDYIHAKQLSDTVQSILTVSTREIRQTHIHRPLKDTGNSQETFEKAAEALRKLLDHGNTTLVHCIRGKNRSCAVAAAALATIHNLTVGGALEWVRIGSPGFPGNQLCDPEEELVEHAEKYVENR